VGILDEGTELLGLLEDGTEDGIVVGDNVGSEIGHNVGSEIGDNVGSEIGDNVGFTPVYEKTS